MKKILVCGAGGFIGNHLVNSLKKQGYYVVGADLKLPEFSSTLADEFYVGDLRNFDEVDKLMSNGIYEIYQLAADMGGAGYVFVGEHDADIMRNSIQININILNAMLKHKVTRVFYSSSACIYPEYNQLTASNPQCEESSAYPAEPDSEYGWEKLLSERIYLAHARNYNFRVRIARLHNVFGPYGSWKNGREKAPAALCRKVVESNGVIDIWGDGNQTRSFLFIDDCIEGIHNIVNGDYSLPLNLGSERMISINDLGQLIAKIAKKSITINNIPGPVGVVGRNSNNNLIKQYLNWAPKDNLEYGLSQTYHWILNEINKQS